MAMPKPLPSSSSMRSRPTSTPSSRRSTVDDELRPSFSSSRVTSTWSPSRTNAETPAAPGFAASVRAKSRIVPPKPPFVIHCFVPVIVQPSPSGSAAVRSEAASEPASGSVSANAPIFSPRASERHEPRSLLVGAEGEDRQRDGARVHRDRDADPRVAPRQLLEHEDVRDEVGAGPAVLLGHADAEEAELTERAQQLPREAVRAVPRGGLGDDPLVRELARERLDLALVGCRLEVH